MATIGIAPNDLIHVLDPGLISRSHLSLEGPLLGPPITVGDTDRSLYDIFSLHIAPRRANLHCHSSVASAGLANRALHCSFVPDLSRSDVRRTARSGA